MANRFFADPATAHELTALKRKHNFFFRTLTRTDNIARVYCETSNPGREFIIASNIKVDWEK